MSTLKSEAILMRRSDAANESTHSSCVITIERLFPVCNAIQGPIVDDTGMVICIGTIKLLEHRLVTVYCGTRKSVHGIAGLIEQPNSPHWLP